MKFQINKISFPTALFALFLFSTGCNQSASPDQMMQDETTRTEIFDQISGDEQMMNDFMNHARNHHGHMMHNSDDMMGMMHDDPEVMQRTMQAMVQDGEMMSQMMQMMHQQGNLSQECLQSMQEMMQENGMTSGTHMEGEHHMDGDHMMDNQ